MIVDSQDIALNVTSDQGNELDPGVPEIVELNVGGSLITTTRRCLSNRITTFCLLPTLSSASTQSSVQSQAATSVLSQ
jgi:hypothetical protein